METCPRTRMAIYLNSLARPKFKVHRITLVGNVTVHINVKTSEKTENMTLLKESLEVWMLQLSQCFSRQVTAHIWAWRGVTWAWWQRAFTNSCNLLIDRTPLMRDASHTTFHPTSWAIFGTRGTLPISAQLASSDSLPILKMISLNCRLETPPLSSFRRSSVI